MPISKTIIAVLPSPSALFGASAEYCLLIGGISDLTISAIKVVCDSDPATELDWDLYYADDFITKANATLIRAMDTTGGILSATSGFGDASVPAGKTIYSAFSSQPDAGIKQITLQIEYSFD